MKRHGRDKVRGNCKKAAVVQSTSNVLPSSWAHREGDTHELRGMHNKKTDCRTNAIAATVPICTATLMAMVPPEVLLKGLAPYCVRDCHLSMAGTPRTRVPSSAQAGRCSHTIERVRASGESPWRLSPRAMAPHGISFKTMNLRFVT